MKLLKLTPYCFPEQISSTHLSADLNQAFIDAGFEIEYFVPTPSRGITKEVREEYRKKRYEVRENGRVIIHRFSMFPEKNISVLKAARYLIVNIVQYFKGVHAKDVDVLFAGSTPPTQGILYGLVKKKLKVPFVYNLQDIFPDSLVNARLTKKGSLVWKIGRRIEDFTYNSADRIIVISEGFKRNIMEKGVPEEKIVVVSNWIDLEDVKPIERCDNTIFSEFDIDPNKFLVVYAGNFGVTQGADIVLKAAEQLKTNTDIHFVIFGGGSQFEEVKQEAEHMSNVFVHRLLPQNRVSEVYSLGDVALITCKKGTGGAGLPSKTWSIMACETRIIAAFDKDSDLANVIKDSNAGVCVEPENTDELVNAIENAYSDYRKGRSYSMRLRNYVEENASREKCVGKYLECVKCVIQNK